VSCPATRLGARASESRAQAHYMSFGAQFIVTALGRGTTGRDFFAWRCLMTKRLILFLDLPQRNVGPTGCWRCASEHSRLDCICKCLLFSLGATTSSNSNLTPVAQVQNLLQQMVCTLAQPIMILFILLFPCRFSRIMLALATTGQFNMHYSNLDFKRCRIRLSTEVPTPPPLRA
jgi:hypothetical protein